MRTRCGHCKSDFANPTKAAAHVVVHEPIVRTPSKGRSIWTVRYTRTGEIAEVLSGPGWV